MSNMGRRTKCTPQLIEELCQVLRAGNYVKVACEYVGIDESTYFKWVQRAEEELDRMERMGHEEPKESERVFVDFLKSATRARRSAEVESVAQIRKAGKDDWKAAAWFLEHGHRPRWGKRRLDVDVTSNGKQMEPIALYPSEGMKSRMRDNDEDNDE